MKISSFTILFVLFFLLILVPIDLSEFYLDTMTTKKIEYNRRIDNAVDDAMLEIEVDDSNKLTSNRDITIKRFYRSLYSNFGISENPIKQKELNIYIPIILFFENDGFYVYYNAEYINQLGEKEFIVSNTEKIPYAMEDKRYAYGFQLNDNFIRVFDKNTGEIFLGTLSDLLDQNYTSEVLKSDKFDYYRRKTIIDCIMKEMSYYVNQNNIIAKQFGVTYEFTIPMSAKDLDRTIDDMGILAIFQGYPFGTPSMGYYNRYVFGASRISKKNLYYISEKNEKMYYHKYTCKELSVFETGYSDKKECAAEGAFVCPICKP